jgi:hypothetical protein
MNNLAGQIKTMKTILFLVAIPLYFSIGCNTSLKNDQSKKNDSATVDQTAESAKNNTAKTLHLDYNFKVEAKRGENFGNFTTYTFFKLTQNDNAVFLDSSLTEYEFDDTLYPIVLKTGEDSYQLLFEINDRPNKNYLKRLFVTHEKVVQSDKLPTFLTKPIDIKHNGILEYVGFWDYSEIWGEKDNHTAYNPLLFFSLTKNGLQLDSLLTIEQNKKIYGEFHGYSYDEKIEMPISVNKKFEKEIELIKGKH